MRRISAPSPVVDRPRTEPCLGRKRRAFFGAAIVGVASFATPATGSPTATTDVAVVRFAGPPDTHQLDQLARSVEMVYTYLAPHGFLVKLRDDAPTALASLGRPGTAAVEPWLPTAKHHPNLIPWLTAELARRVEDDTTSRGPAGTGRNAAPGDDELAVILHLLPDHDVATVETTLQKLDLLTTGDSAATAPRHWLSLARPRVVTARSADDSAPAPERFALQPRPFTRLRLLVQPALLAARFDALRANPAVAFIEIEARRVLLNDTSIWVGQSGLLAAGTTPIYSHGIFGANQVVAVLDTGIDPDMCFFRDQTFGLPPVNACNGGTTIDANQRKVLAVNFLHQTECNGGISNTEWDNHDHGTHVAGSVAGDNFLNLGVHDTADGMAPLAKLVIQDGGLTTDNCADLPGIGCPVVDLQPIFQQTYDQGARLHSNSWGDNENAAVQNNYTAASEDADTFTWSHRDFLVLFAAGNGGNSTGRVSSPSTAKNVVSVGASNRGSNAGTIASFSSCGPTDDGRVKPDLTAPGSGIISADNDGNVTTNNCGTRSMSGTSMATPTAAGLTALAREYFTAGFYPGGVANPGDGFTPSAALLRATMINSTTAMTGIATPPPSICQGWGRILLDDTLAFPGDPRQLFVTDEADSIPFATGSVGDDRVFEVSIEAGAPLDITVAWSDFPSTPVASIHLVNDLDLEVTAPGTVLYRGNVMSGGQSTTGGSADRRNNVEQVILQSPVGGRYRIVVRSFTVPSGPQPFALVVSGAGAQLLSVFGDGFESGDANYWSSAVP